MDRRLLTPDLLLERVKGSFEASKYVQIEPAGLISPSFPDTFAASVFHNVVVDLIQQDGCAVSKRLWGIDWAFRHVDLAAIGHSPWHLSIFRMLVWLISSPADCSDGLGGEIVRRTIALLRKMDLDLSRLYFSTFAGGRSGLSSQVRANDEVIVALNEEGFSDDQIIHVVGDRLLTNIRRGQQPAGPRCEVFYKADCGALVEIGTLVSEQYRLSANLRMLVPTPQHVYGVALGVERLAAVAAGLKSLFELQPILLAADSLALFGQASLASAYQVEFRRAIDAGRALVGILHTTGGKIAGRNRRRLLKQLKRRVADWANSVGVDERHVIDLLVQCFSAEMGAIDQSGSIVNTIEALSAGVREE